MIDTIIIKFNQEFKEEEIKILIDRIKRINEEQHIMPEFEVSYENNNNPST